MKYKLDLDSRSYFSTTNISTIANRKYAIDSSFLPEDTKYKMTYNFCSNSLTKEYPPIGLTSNTTDITNQLYGNGTYIASASTEFDSGFQAFETFNKIYDEPLDRWRSVNGVYFPAGSYNGSAETSIDGVLRKGEWLQIELPSAISLDKFSLTCRIDDGNKGMAGSFYIAGSNNTIDWNEVYFATGLTWSGIETKTFTTTNKTSFKYLRYVVLSIYSPIYTNTHTFTALNEWVLYASALKTSIIKINLGGMMQQNYIVSNNTFKSTSFSGILEESKAVNQLVASPTHNPSIYITKRLQDNFIEVDLYEMDMITPLLSNGSYLLTLYFDIY